MHKYINIFLVHWISDCSYCLYWHALM